MEGCDMWKITKFSDMHNHDMVSPKSVTLLRSHKVYSKAAKSLTESFSRAGVPLARVPHVFGTVDVPFDVLDCYNHMKKIRTIIYEVGDAQAVQQYCTQQLQADPHFFYSIQFDEDSRMLNFLWIDSRFRRAYENFGDVVTFDTTYRTNKYSMPFAPFVGINHHLQSVMFGCALLHDETEETFKWVFQTWVAAMNGKSPLTIITDQDVAMGKAISEVFPLTRHRLCLWHITKKFPEKLSHIYHESSTFKKEFNEIIYNSTTVSLFEERWNDMIGVYQLEDNQWLKGLYLIRHSWIPVFNRSNFSAGMSTTQRSESINAFFNAFVHSGMTLREFVVKYDLALDSRYESYRKEEFDSNHKERRLTLHTPLEEHAASVYTRNVFCKFHEELMASMMLSKEKISKFESQSVYRVWNRKDKGDDHTVNIDFSNLDVVCSCQYFEFMGILCRHILAIFHAKSIEQIPEKYILQRWRKEGNKMYGRSGSHCREGMTMQMMELQQLYSQLDEYAEKSESAYNFINNSLEATLAKCCSIVEDELSRCKSATCTTEVESNCGDLILKDPQVSQTKGRKRIKSGVELSKKNTNICGNCGSKGHNRRSCKHVIM